MSLHELGQSDVAIPHLDRAVSFDLGNRRAWANRGHVRRERGELELAIGDFSRSLKQQPSYTFSLFRRAQCYAALNRAVDAEHDLEAVLTTNTFDEAPFALWQSLREQRGERAGRGALPQPQGYFGLLQRALVFSSHGELELAIVDYYAAFALAPELIVRASRGRDPSPARQPGAGPGGSRGVPPSEPNNELTRAALEDLRAKLVARQSPKTPHKRARGRPGRPFCQPTACPE